MSFYQRWVLPWLIDLSMRNKEARRYRERTIPLAKGRVLEIGIGSGLNLPFYGKQVEQLVAVDPSAELLRMAEKRARKTAIPIEFIPHTGEELPLTDASVDTAVFTFTLCTIPDPLMALREARRVLKPSGELLFAEHGLAPDARVRAWQRRLNPLWSRIGGGCNLDRKIDELIAAAGFRFAALETEYAKGPRPMSYVYVGRAKPDDAWRGIGGDGMH
ncbi:MAG: class I SAM-dependent methyltransferase [Betaproteobacteria bacterium]|nr:class I SAM-dependent methyltransferase [Betaproteobacteria bacterium]